MPFTRHRRTTFRPRSFAVNDSKEIRQRSWTREVDRALYGVLVRRFLMNDFIDGTEAHSERCDFFTPTGARPSCSSSLCCCSVDPLRQLPSSGNRQPRLSDSLHPKHQNPHQDDCPLSGRAPRQTGAIRRNYKPIRLRPNRRDRCHLPI